MMGSFARKEDTYKRYKGIEVERPKGPRPLAKINPELLFKNTVFSSESDFLVNGNNENSFKIGNALQYMSLKVTSKFTSNHKDVEVPVTQDSKDDESILETLIIDYPFTFYVTDIRSKVVLAAGKVVELKEIDFSNDGNED